MVLAGILTSLTTLKVPLGIELMLSEERENKLYVHLVAND